MFILIEYWENKQRLYKSKIIAYIYLTVIGHQAMDFRQYFGNALRNNDADCPLYANFPFPWMFLLSDLYNRPKAIYRRLAYSLDCELSCFDRTNCGSIL